jgi:hypothetical protein
MKTGQKEMGKKTRRACKKKKSPWLYIRRILPGLLLLLFLLFSMAAAGYVIFFRATPIQASAPLASVYELTKGVVFRQT